MKKTLNWLDENLEEFLLVVMLAAMTLIMGIQIFSRYALGQSLSWSEEVTRFLFIWSGFLSVSYCSKKMPFYQDRTVRRRLPAQRKGSF